MRILTFPAHATLTAAAPARATLIVHNDGDDDAVCFPTLEGLDQTVDAIFEPSIGFVEARCAAKFAVYIEARSPNRHGAKSLQCNWTLYSQGRVADRRPIMLHVEPHRSLSARVTESARPELVLFNEGAVEESVVIESLLDARATPAMARHWALGPGSWVSVPLEFEQADSAHATLCITGGPRPLLVETPVVQIGRAAAVDRRLRRIAGWRRMVVATGAIAASLLIGFPLDRAVPGTAAAGPMLADAMPFVALSDRVSAVNVGDADRLLGERVIALTSRIARARRALMLSASRMALMQRPSSAPPAVTKLDAPSEVQPGSRVAIKFGSTAARSVRIVAKIGPTIVQTFEVNSAGGQVSLRAPQAHKSSRLMTVRAYALGGDHLTATRETLVSIVPG